MKKVLIFGGGRGMSVLLKGLKQFPVDITAVVTVADDGSSTGKLREEFSIPAVGDIREVLIALSDTEDQMKELLEYRFKQKGSNLDNHTVGNVILTAMTKITGNLREATKVLTDLFRVKGKILPFTNDLVTLVAKMSDGSVVEGEHHITENSGTIVDIWYKEKPTIAKELLTEIKEANLIIFGIGSLYTSIIPNILSEEVVEAIKHSKAKKLHICNAMTQRGETGGFNVSDTINVLNKYMKGEFLDAVIVSNTKIPKEVVERYKDLEQKSTILQDLLLIDEKTNTMNLEVIEEDLIRITKEGFIEHDYLKTGFAIFSYLMKRDNL